MFYLCRENEIHAMTDSILSSSINNTWQGNITCQQIDHSLKADLSQMKSFVHNHMYCLVERGWVSVQFGKYEVKISASEFMIFPPHIPPFVLSTSDDFRAIYLAVSSNFILDCPSARYVSHTSTYSLLHESSPCIALSPKDQETISNTMKMFMQRMSSPTHYTKDALQSLYGLFLSDLMAIFDTTPVHSIENQSGFKLFVEFNRLLLADFCEHHEVSYYAQRMGISSRYLSMIVKQVSHTTVAAYINQHLMLEACWLLKTSEHNIQEISDLLHFADQASFSKFFKRQKGLSPLQYRKMEHSSKMRAM